MTAIRNNDRVGTLIFTGQFTRLASLAQAWMARFLPGLKELG